MQLNAVASVCDVHCYLCMRDVKFVIVLFMVYGISLWEYSSVSVSFTVLSVYHVL